MKRFLIQFGVALIFIGLACFTGSQFKEVNHPWLLALSMPFLAISMAYLQRVWYSHGKIAGLKIAESFIAEAKAIVSKLPDNKKGKTK